MTPRFQRGKTGAISPFFVFQDMITSATAVLIAFAMLLALGLGAAPWRESAEPETPALAARLKSVLDRLAGTQEELRNARETAGQEEADPALLQARIQILRRELDLVRADAGSREKEALDIRDKDATRELRSELDSKRAKNAKAAGELQKIEAEAALSLQEVERLQADVKGREAALMDEHARGNQLWVVPDRAASSKEPVLAVISENQAIFQRFDHPEQEILNGPQVTDGFAEALKHYSPDSQYIVLYFKPSGADHFKRLTQEAKDAGFETSYDAINEDVQVHFKTPK